MMWLRLNGWHSVIPNHCCTTSVKGPAMNCMMPWKTDWQTQRISEAYCQNWRPSIIGRQVWVSDNTSRLALISLIHLNFFPCITGQRRWFWLWWSMEDETKHRLDKEEPFCVCSCHPSHAHASATVLFLFFKCDIVYLQDVSWRYGYQSVSAHI